MGKTLVAIISMLTAVGLFASIVFVDTVKGPTAFGLAIIGLLCMGYSWELLKR